MLLTTVALVLVSYILGSIPFGFLAGKAKGVDIRTAGSGNIGATNAGRVLGWKIGISVFVLDFLKGAIPPAVALWILDLPTWVAILSGLVSFAGHLFPIWLKFKGGKGVATAAGVTAVLLPIPFLLSLATWILLLLAWRMVSLSSIGAALVLIGAVLTWHDPFGPGQLDRTLFGLISGVLVILKHNSNIKRILAGTENEIRLSRGLDGLSRILHIGATGGWVGIGWFFTFVIGLGIFGIFGDIATKPQAERPWWLPVPQVFEKSSPGAPFPEPLRKEQGSLIAGQAVSAVFPAYFEIQVWLAFTALATAVGWRQKGKLHRNRVKVLGIALLLLLCGWALERQVSAKRFVRNDSLDKALTTRDPLLIHEAAGQRIEFNRLHGYSVLLNLITLTVATLAMGLAAFPPALPLSKEQLPADPLAQGSE